MFLAFALVLAAGQGVAPPPVRPLGPRPAIAWDCVLLGPAGETHRVSGRFLAPVKVTQGSYGSFARVAVKVDNDTTGLLIGEHQGSGSYAIPASFMFAGVNGDVITSFTMSYFGEGAGGLATVTQTDAARRAPPYPKPVGTGYCRTSESAR